MSDSTDYMRQLGMALGPVGAGAALFPDTAKLIASRLPPAVLAGLTGDPTAQSLPGRIIPGVIQTNVGMLGDILTSSYNAGAKAHALLADTPVPAPVEPPDFVEDAKRHAAQSLLYAQRDIPTAIEPTTPFESAVAGATDQLGINLPLGMPGAARTLAAKYLPNAVVDAAKYLSPALLPGQTFPKLTAAGAVIGGAAPQVLMDNPPPIRTGNDLPPPQAGNLDYHNDVLDFRNLRVGDQSQQPTSPQQAHDPLQAATSPPNADSEPLDFTGITDIGTPQGHVPMPPTGDQSSFGIGDTFALLGGPAVALLLHAPAAGVWRQATMAKRLIDIDRYNEVFGQRIGDPNFPRPVDYNPAAPPELPNLPIPGTGFLNSLKVRLIDQSARVQAIGRYYASTPDEWKRFQAAVVGTGDLTTAKTRIDQFMRTGTDWQTGFSIPSPAEFVRRHSLLTPEQQAAFDQAAKYEDAYNDRMLLAKQAGIAQPTPDMVTKFPEITTPDLTTQITNLRRDQAVSDLLDDYHASKEAMTQLANEWRGLISDETARRINITRPEHTSETDPFGRILGLFRERPLEAGVGPHVDDTPVIVSWPQQIAKLVRAMDLNDRTRVVIEQIDQAQRANTRTPRLVSQLVTPAGEAVDDPQRMIITFGTRQGVQSWEIADRELYEYLKRGDNSLPLNNSIASAWNRISQSTITGSLAAATGYVFALVNAPRTMLQMAAERRAGTAAGLADLGTQKLTGAIADAASQLPGMSGLAGKSFGYRGFDPTTPFLMAGDIVANVSALAVKAFADTMARQTGPLATLLRGVMGQANFDRMVDEVNDLYASSHLSDLRTQGIGLQTQGYAPTVRGSETFGDNRNTFQKILNPSKEYPNNPMFEQVPEQYHPEGSGTIIHIRKFLKDMLDIIHSSPSSVYNRLNRGRIPRDQLAFETAQLFGSPGTEGTSTGLRALMRTVPYAAPTVQGLARTARAYAENPAATTIGKVMTYAPLVLMERYLAMSGGPEHQRVLDHELTPEQQANGLYFMTGADPHQYQILSVAQSDRPYTTAMRFILRHITSTDDANHDPDSRKTWLDNVHQFFGDYITHTDAQALLHSVVQNVDPLIQAPALIQAGAAGLGYNIQPQANRLIDAAVNNPSRIGSTIMRPINAPYALPGQDSVHDAHRDPADVMNIISSGFGNLAKVFSEIYHETAKAHTLGEAWDRGFDAMSQNMKDRNMLFNNVLFTNSAPLLARGDYTQQTVMNTLNQLRSMQGLQTGAAVQGLTRKGGETVPITGQSLYPTDPIMQEVFAHGTALRNHMEGTVLKQITDLDKERQALKNLPITQTDMREQANKISAQIRAKYAEAAELIRIANTNISDMVGAPVNFGQKIDWSKGATQFLANGVTPAQPGVPLDFNGMR